MAEVKEKDTPKAGAASILSREEKNAPKKESKDKSLKKKSRHKHTHIEHHYDESGKATGHTVRHTPEGGGPETSYAAKDLDEVHDGLEQHVGEPNGDEGQEMPEAPEQTPPAAQPSAQPAPQAGM